MEDKHGVKELKALLGLFGLAPETVEKIDRLLHASGEYNRLPSTWRSMDTTTKLLLRRVLGDVPGSDNGTEDSMEVQDDGRGVETQGQEDEAPATSSARFEGFKGGFQDFLKEVTISVDSEDPDARMKMQQQLRRASTSQSGERMIARDNVQRAQAARKAIDPEDPNKSLKDREMKRREMAAREERKRIMQEPSGGTM